MSKFRKKPVVIEAYCVATDNFFPEWLNDAIEAGSVYVGSKGRIHITTLEGTMTANFDDYIIRGVKGELYPCKPDIFEATYEAVDDGAPQDMGNMNDGYHTFNELYEHRHVLFLIVMAYAWMAGNRTWLEYDNETDGWFLAGIDTLHGQISYHLPMRLLPIAQRQVTEGYQRVPYDGYTAADVLRRLQALAGYSPQEAAMEPISKPTQTHRPEMARPAGARRAR